MEMTPAERKKFYNECMDCRVTAFGSIEAEEVDEFYRLINEYADKKYATLKEQLEFQRIKAETFYDWIAQWDGYSDPEDIQDELWHARNGYNTNHVQVYFDDKLTDEYKESLGAGDS